MWHSGVDFGINGDASIHSNGYDNVIEHGDTIEISWSDKEIEDA